MSSVATAVKNWEKRQWQSTLLKIKPSAAESKPFFTVCVVILSIWSVFLEAAKMPESNTFAS